MLLHRHDLDVVGAVERLVGLQAQAPWSPYVSVWSRIERFDPHRLGQALLDRELVRIVVMRGTIHLVSAADACELRPLVQPLLDKDIATNASHAAGLAGIDLDELARATHEVLADEPLSPRALGVALATRFADRPPAALGHGARNRVPLVQTPPRAVWGRTGGTAYATLEQWLDRPLSRRPDLAAMAQRYFAAYGPATVQDLQTWCGLTRLAPVVDGLRDQLVLFTTEDGRQLYDLPDAPRPDPSTPAPIRFLPDYDNLLRSHADRSFVVADAHRRRALATPNGVVPSTVLVDGEVRAVWRHASRGDSAVLSVEPLEPLDDHQAEEIEAEGHRLLELLDTSAEPTVTIARS